MTAPAVRTRGLTKDYGEGFGVFDLDLEVQPGEVFGYLGPNGAGKSTTIRMLLDMVRPTAGSAELFGTEVRAGGPPLRSRVTYVPGELNLWDGSTAREIIDYLVALHTHGGARPDDLDVRVDRLAGRLQLNLDRSVSELSKGNKQKVGLVAAFAVPAELLILDEPTSGLDPLLQVEFQHMVNEVADEGAAVLLSSHVLSEVEHAADRVGIIRRGRLVDTVSMRELKAQASRSLEVTFAENAPDDIERATGVTEESRHGTIARYRVEGSMDTLIKAIAAHAVVSVRSDDSDLEQIFLTYYADPDRPAEEAST